MSGKANSDADATIEEPSKPLKPKPSKRELYRFYFRYFSHPETLEPFIASLQGTSIPEQNITLIKLILPTIRNSLRDPIMHRADRYLSGSLGAIEIVLLAVVLAQTTFDRSLVISLFALVISLPLLSFALFISFVKSEFGIVSYGKFHSTTMFFALLSGNVGIVALLWHVSAASAILFLCLTCVLSVAASAYLGRLLLVKHYAEEQKSQGIILTDVAPKLQKQQVQNPLHQEGNSKDTQ